MQTFVFFGLGAAGSVMACCLHELCERQKEKARFLFIVRNPEEAKQYLFRAQGVLDAAGFLVLKDFRELFEHPKRYEKHLKGATVLINTAVPTFNDPILKLAAEFGIHYCDLASEMYNEQTERTLQFSQQEFHEPLKQKGKFGLINVGVAPGVTNFLIGEKLLTLTALPSVRVLGIDIYLLEHITSRQVVFSWSPMVALDELEQKPRYLAQGTLHTVEPFSGARPYAYPHFPAEVEAYPLYQEEILSLHQSFPQIPSIRMFAGGSEVELIKNLYQLNLLSKQDIECVKKNMSVEEIVRMVLPGLETPQEIERLLHEGIIKYAQFAAMAELTLAVESGKGEKRMTVKETTGFSFHQYKDLLNTPYSGSTYIAYVTGVGAAILTCATLRQWQKQSEKLTGILRAEALPAIFGPEVTDSVKRDLCAYKLDFISHTHSFT